MESPDSAAQLGLKLLVVFLVTLAIAYFSIGGTNPEYWNIYQRTYITFIYVAATLYTIFSHKRTN